MKTFKQFIRESISGVYRIDAKKINDFSQTHEYEHNRDWSVSGRGSPMRTGMQHTKGLYAGEKKDVANYAVPRDVRSVSRTDPKGHSTIYFDPKDEKRIRGFRPTITRFSKGSFKSLKNAGDESFSEKPDKPISQNIIHDPVSFMKSQGNKVKFTKHLDAVNIVSQRMKGTSRGEGF